LLDRIYKSWYYNYGGGIMDEKKIKEIMKDPNTWEWDGCTLPEDAESHYPKEFNDKWAKFVEQHKSA